MRIELTVDSTLSIYTASVPSLRTRCTVSPVCSESFFRDGWIRDAIFVCSRILLPISRNLRTAHILRIPHPDGYSPCTGAMSRGGASCSYESKLSAQIHDPHRTIFRQTLDHLEQRSATWIGFFPVSSILLVLLSNPADHSCQPGIRADITAVSCAIS